MPRILFLSFYYPPDLSAGSFRCKALIDALQIQYGNQIEIDIISTLPNRYNEINIDAAVYEKNDGLSINRIALPSHKSGMVDQAWAFLSFAREAIQLVQKKNYDAVFSTSSRLMTAALGAHIAGRKKCPLYLDIRDLFVDTMGDILTNPLIKAAMPLFWWLERKTFSQAEAISIVSAAFEPYVKSIARTPKIWLSTNGIDQEFLDTSFTSSHSLTSVLPTILYAGNIGEGQGLELVLPRAAEQLLGKANFKIIGSGGRLQQLKSATEGLGNVKILPPVGRSELMEHYQAADVLLIHLNDHQAFRKVLPSKLFEYAATRKPVVAGVAGHASDFIKQNVAGAFVFAPCDSHGLQIAVQNALAGSQYYDRTGFREEFARSSIMKELAQRLMSDLSDSIGARLS